METGPIRYTSDDEDSGRWQDFAFRDGDIVISTRSKSGTTWMQMICALLVFQTPDLPAPLASLSPWVDHAIIPLEEVLATLERQQHRRFVKTHTPLDGIPLDHRATYIVVARDPRDLYISLWHQGNNIDRATVRRLLGKPEPADEEPPPRTPLPEAIQRWIDDDSSPLERMDGIRGVFHHVNDAWTRRVTASQPPALLLVHYSDLLADLEGEMRALAAQLDIAVPEERWPALAEAATFASMRTRAGESAPGAGGVLKDPQAFFRRGASGGWREVMTTEQVARYHRRAAELAPPNVVAWLHR